MGVLCSTSEFVFSGKLSLDRNWDLRQVKIGEKGTKEGSQLPPYSPHSASLSDQPSAEAGPTYCTRGGPIQGEKSIRNHLTCVGHSLGDFEITCNADKILATVH